MYRGSFATVKKATHRESGTGVAIKIIQKGGDHLEEQEVLKFLLHLDILLSDCRIPMTDRGFGEHKPPELCRTS